MDRSRTAASTQGTVRITAPDGKIINFPKGTPSDVIDREMSRLYPKIIDTNKKLPYAVANYPQGSGALSNLWGSIKKGIDTPLIPAEQLMRKAQPKEYSGPVGEAFAGTGLGLTRLIEQLSTPKNAALGLAAGAAGSVGMPGFILNAGFSGKMLKDAYDQFMKETSPGTLAREKYADKITAGLDALMAVLPFTKANKGQLPKGTTRNELRGLVGMKPKKYVTSKTEPAPASKPVSAPLVVPPSQSKPVSSSKPIAADPEPIETREPWYVKAERAKELEEDPFGDPPIPPSSPLPEIPMGHKAQVLSEIESATDMRMNEIADLFESGLGSLSGKGKNVEGLSDMSYSGSQDVKTGFGKLRVKGAGTPEVEGFKESPGRIAEAIRKDGNNPLYVKVREAVKSNLRERMAPEIQAREEQLANLDPDGFFNYERAGIREPGQEGYADIKAKSDANPFLDAWTLSHPKGGNMEVRFGDNGAYVDQVRVPKQLQGQGIGSDLYTHLGEMMRDRGIPGSAIEGNIQAERPAQIARLRAKAAEIAGEGKAGADRFEVFGDEDPNEFLRNAFGEEGFADTKKDQAGFNFVPMNIPGQKPEQSIGDLYNQILQTPDAAISKRDLLGISKKSKKQTEAPLFDDVFGTGKLF